MDAIRKRKDKLTRRELIATASVASLGAAVLSASEVRAQEQETYQVGKDPGKHEPIADFKFDIEATKGWVGEAGSAKEATLTEFPASKNIAGVSMRLKPGGIRELHWHAIAAECTLVLTGRVLTTVIAPNRQPATDIFEPGDIWYFPKGHGHALQNISNEEAHFVLGFDDGHFSEFGTFSITEWVARTPQTVVSRNLGLSPGAISGLPKKELYILPGRLPPAVPQQYLAADLDTTKNSHKFRRGQRLRSPYPGSWERIVSVKEFPITTDLPSVLV